jgi:hypothetical protein
MMEVWPFRSVPCQRSLLNKSRCHWPEAAQNAARNSFASTTVVGVQELKIKSILVFRSLTSLNQKML